MTRVIMDYMAHIYDAGITYFQSCLRFIRANVRVTVRAVMISVAAGIHAVRHPETQKTPAEQKC
jgi:hypothetical protein